VTCHIYLENSWPGLKFAIDFTSIGSIYKKLWPSKVWGVPISGIWDSKLGSLWTKWHLNVAPVANHKEHYKGEGGDLVV
jgi:hypothetical protein